NNPAPAVPKPTDLTPDDQLEDAYKQINASLASDLLSEFLKITPYTFESSLLTYSMGVSERIEGAFKNTK
ncbi:MAG TPA: hypothetical protein P5522_06205, partial [Spirochaetia bacterium]|nr:hypothetical protein [Spirochaetia bacterium]